MLVDSRSEEVSIHVLVVGAPPPPSGNTILVEIHYRQAVEGVGGGIVPYVVLCIHY